VEKNPPRKKKNPGWIPSNPGSSMLTQLSIRNIVLIESCDVALKSGLCTLSGETGAGKTILLDSLGLVLGARSDASLVRKGEEQATVSAEFDIAENANARAVLKELDIEDSDTLIIRRTLSADGKTRCLANDQVVTVAALKKLGETLVEIHGQHDQRTLLDMTIHRALLDDYAGLNVPRKKVADAYAAWKKELMELEALKAEVAAAARELEYLKHMRAEMKQLDPQPGEEDELTEQRTKMMQSEKLFDVLNQAIGELNNSKSVSAALRSAERILARSPLTSGEEFKAILEGLDKAAEQAEEAQYQLEKIGQQSQFNPEKLEQVEERLFALKAAGRKYNLPIEELPNLYEQVEEKLALIESQDKRIKTLEESANKAKSIFLDVASALSESRKKSALKLEKNVEAELKPLKMDGTRFVVRVSPQAESGWSEWGIDTVSFECATNIAKGDKDITTAPLSKIASGGELSRFMLALKVALLSVRQASTLIFDEIDSGTGGAVADAIGQRLALLGKSAQVLVVTHLPQVAARGSQHLLVAKQEKNRKVTTSVTELSDGARKEELARMLAGATITPEARKAAQKLLEDAA
jgi:DNA repair protein RecN (Recombination protein N)